MSEYLHQSAPLLSGTATAVLSADQAYRYRLERSWGSSGTRAVWIMLNPSTADAFADDPTIRRCVSFAKAWELDGIVVVNLFALRSADPRALAGHPDPVGPGNDEFIREALHPWSVVVAAWGANRAADSRAAAVMAIAAARSGGACCLGRTKAGYPRHPLYVPATAELTAYLPERGAA